MPCAPGEVCASASPPLDRTAAPLAAAPLLKKSRLVTVLSAASLVPFRPVSRFLAMGPFPFWFSAASRHAELPELSSANFSALITVLPWRLRLLYERRQRGRRMELT